MTIIAAADGSALGNPGPAGWAWYVDENRWAAGGWPHGTNNQGELMAVLDLLRATVAHADEELHVLCDSQYVINTVTKWMPGWKRKGWRKADGSPVLNLDIITQLDDSLTGRTCTFEWVKGHAGHELNEAADQRARAAALAYQDGSTVPSGPGWPGDLRRLPAESNTEDEALVALSDVVDDMLDEVVDVLVVERLERRLLDPAIRADPAELAALLDPDFREIGSSGRLWDRETVIQSLETQPLHGVTLDVLETERVSDDAILLVLRIADARDSSLRSSLWLRRDGRWRLRFSQGTHEA